MQSKNFFSFLLIIIAFCNFLITNGCSATSSIEDEEISSLITDWEKAQNLYKKLYNLKVEYGEFKNANLNLNIREKTEHEKEFIKKLVEIFDMASSQQMKHNPLSKIREMENLMAFAESHYEQQLSANNRMVNHIVDEQKRAEHVEMMSKCKVEYLKMSDMKYWLQTMQTRFYTPGETMEKAIKEELIPRLAIGQKKKTTLLKIFENTGINDDADDEKLAWELAKLLGKFGGDKEILKAKILKQIGQCKTQFWKQILENMLDESSPFSKYATKAAESDGAGADSDDKKEYENDEASSSTAAESGHHHKKHQQ